MAFAKDQSSKGRKAHTGRNSSDDQFLLARAFWRTNAGKKKLATMTEAQISALHQQGLISD